MFKKLSIILIIILSIDILIFISLYALITYKEYQHQSKLTSQQKDILTCNLPGWTRTEWTADADKDACFAMSSTVDPYPLKAVPKQ